MSHLITWESWALSEEADRRYRRILLLVAIPAIIIAALITIFQLTVKKTEQEAYNAARYAQLVLQQPAAEQAPAEQPKPAAQNQPKPPQQAPKQRVEKQPTPPVPQPTAREKAQKEMKVFDQLNELRDQKLTALNDQQLVSTPIIGSRGSVSGMSAEAIANSAAATSGSGVGGTGSYTSTQSGTGLGTRRTGAVSSNLGLGDSGRVGPNGKLGRSLQEVNEVFDRNKAGFIAIYNREARQSPDLGAGEVVVHLLIAPDGSVTSVSLVSSTYNNPEFEQKILARVRMLNFGAKAVPPFDVAHYPIHIQPM